MRLRKRNYIIEDIGQTKILKKYPNNTIIRGSGLVFSSWGGDLALVDTLERDFDPESMSRVYHVRFAIRDGKHIKAEDRFIGDRPRIDNPSLPYEKTKFSIGNMDYGRGISGGFSKLFIFKVGIDFKSLNNDEQYMVENFFRKKNMIDISYVHNKYKIPVRNWRIILGESWKKIQDGDYNMANAVDDIVHDIVGSYDYDDQKAQSVWSKIGGVYALGKNGKIKMAVIKR